MSDQPRLPEILVTSRPLENYLGFFDLDRSDLIGRRILDCPGGASSFTAEANNLGAFAAVDPTYRATADELDTLGRQQIEYSGLLVSQQSRPVPPGGARRRQTSPRSSAHDTAAFRHSSTTFGSILSTTLRRACRIFRTQTARSIWYSVHTSCSRTPTDST